MQVRGTANRSHTPPRCYWVYTCGEMANLNGDLWQGRGAIECILGGP